MSGRPSRSVVPLALFGALLIVGLNTWFAVAAIQSLLQSDAWLAHTWEVIGQEQQVMATITTAESASRSFVIAGQQEFLEPYEQTRQQLPRQIDHLKQLTVDNSVQQTAIEELRGVAERRMAYLDRSIASRRTGGFEAAQSLIATGMGTLEMDRLRSIVGGIDTEERRLLSNRMDEARRDGERSFFAIALAAVLDFLMIGFVTRYFQREREARVASEVANERLAVANAEVKRNAEALNALNAQLEQRVLERTAELETTNRELEAFSYSVSHDLRAPLRTIDGFSLALQEDYAEAVDATGRDYIQRVRAGVQRMGGLIDALLQLSRITRAELVREPVNLLPIAETVAEALREENPGRSITFTLTAGPAANADPRLVQVALENLIGNAVKFTARREHAEISFGWDEEAKAWRVSDNGAGFDMHYKDKLFNAFNRLHGDKDFKGSGIGLATVARVIRRHHGRIWAEATVDHGATFWFTLG